jgi:hypothetical protein
MVADGCLKISPDLRLDLPGGDLQQGRLARPVAAHKADAVSRFDLQLGAVQQRGSAEGQPDVVEFENGRRHGQASGKVVGPGNAPARARNSGWRSAGPVGHIRDGARRAKDDMSASSERILRTGKAESRSRSR